MSRTDQETGDGWFNGFPAEWNMIIPTLYLIRANPWLNLGVCLAFSALTLSRVQFAHPVSVRQHRPLSLICMIAWLASMTTLAIAQHQILAVRIVLIIAPWWTLIQVVLRLQRSPHRNDELTTR